MNRHGNLWEQVISFESLLHAAEKACKGNLIHRLSPRHALKWHSRR
jgi:hypothetical protein